MRSQSCQPGSGQHPRPIRYNGIRASVKGKLHGLPIQGNSVSRIAFRKAFSFRTNPFQDDRPNPSSIACVVGIRSSKSNAMSPLSSTRLRIESEANSGIDPRVRRVELIGADPAPAAANISSAVANIAAESYLFSAYSSACVPCST